MFFFVMKLYLYYMERYASLVTKKDLLRYLIACGFVFFKIFCLSVC